MGTYQNVLAFEIVYFYDEKMLDLYSNLEKINISNKRLKYDLIIKIHESLKKAEF